VGSTEFLGWDDPHHLTAFVEDRHGRRALLVGRYHLKEAADRTCRRGRGLVRLSSSTPLLGHCAIEDVPFPVATVDLLEQKLRAANVRFEFHRYQAKHAFANETLVAERKLPIAEYQAPSADLAWRRTLEFFDRHLK
jgi:dienelactone hydrolase